MKMQSQQYVYHQSENLASRDGEVFLIESFIAHDEVSNIEQRLAHGLAWDEQFIRMFGKPVKVPRLTCWYGDPGAIYSYSGTRNIPLHWQPLLLSLKRSIELFSKHPFNSVLGNYYRNGNDSMGWHADKEKELGRNPFIASLSLGATRLFMLQHNKSKEIIKLDLSPGSLLLMGGALQHHWRHCLPKTKADNGERINLTFRNVRSMRINSELSPKNLSV